ncbi:hypothetical protein ACH3VR_21840 [Microbacterium sp. B2969]|uniref:Uncharacterized protein n=1 Tax=Microbacterium alkaliflavum TaxID=3248839 RepID=A0ABW7QDV5_9MICO
MTTDVTIPYTQYRSFFENSAAHFGQLDARQTAHLGTFHPGDNIGRLLSRVWTVNPDDAGLAFAAYLVALNNECDRLEVPRPGLKKVGAGLPLAVNENEFPGVDVAKMVATVTREAPGYYSEAV